MYVQLPQAFKKNRAEHSLVVTGEDGMQLVSTILKEGSLISFGNYACLCNRCGRDIAFCEMETYGVVPVQVDQSRSSLTVVHSRIFRRKHSRMYITF